MRKQRPRLLLFDIDGTLLDTCGSGLAALLNAAQEVFGVPRESLPPLDLAGATDGSVIRKLFASTGIAMTDDLVQRYWASYIGHLQYGLHSSAFAGQLLPGVPALLETLATREHLHLGLLTGNLRRGAQLKLARFGIDHFFTDGAFGDDAEDRNHLGPIAVERMASAKGRAFAGSDVVIIGDTPKDIACAAAIGARCVAVATGAFSTEQLLAHRPWRCVESLGEIRL